MKASETSQLWPAAIPREADLVKSQSLVLMWRMTEEPDGLHPPLRPGEEVQLGTLWSHAGPLLAAFVMPSKQLSDTAVGPYSGYFRPPLSLTM